MLQSPTAVLGRATRDFPRNFGSLALLKPLASDERGEVFVGLRPQGVDRLCVVNLLGRAIIDRIGVIDVLRAQAGWMVARVHGNIVQTYDVGQAAERLFLVNEYVEGRDLGALMSATVGRPGGIPVDVGVYIAIELAAALEFIRGQEEKQTGVPTTLLGMSAAAVMISREGTIKLLHSGSSLAPPSAGELNKDVARVSLIAPEHVDGGGSAAGDVYAVAALLWQTLTGQALGGDDGTKHLRALRDGTFKPQVPSAVASKAKVIPAALDELVLTALSAKPSDRPADCELLRAELVLAVKGTGPGGSERVAELLDEICGPALAAEQGELAKLAMIAEKSWKSPGPRAVARTLTNFEGGSGQRRVVEGEPSELNLGEVIPGTRYRALEKLGEGGMGVVYAAEHVDIEKKVALKLVHAELLRNPTVLRQFRQEARAASKIGNPYICDVTDWGELSDGRVFFVMEFLDGIPLGAEIKKRRHLTAERCIPILRQVAKALGAAHEKGIVHLDMKPDNVLLLERGGRVDAVKVVDFGVAGILGQTVGPAKIMGTPEYMAPERALGRGYDHRSDIYSLGVMAYEMLVGEVPFQGPTPIETLAMQAADFPDEISKRLTTPVPQGLEATVMKMLAKEPERRPQGMAEVEALLCEAQIEARIRTPWDALLPLPTMAPDRAARLARRMSAHTRRLRWVAGGAGAAVAAISAIFAIVFATRAPVVVIKEAPAEQRRSPSLVPIPASVARAPAALSTETAGSRRRRDDEGAAARARDPGRAREAVARGQDALVSGRLVQAEKEFEMAISADSSYAAGFGGMAETAFERARYAEAMDFARKATRLGPRISKFQVILGDACYKLGRYAEAAKAYEKALAMNPGDVGIRASLERVSAKLGQQ